jgi:predicted dienelactone hydrolase
MKSHYDTALALAHAGFVAAAISHSGDAYGDMLNKWPQHDRLGARPTGAVGFSNGGFTVLVAQGGVPDLAKMAPYCSAHPEHDLCQALKQAGVDPKIGGHVPPDVWIHDPRIQAASMAAQAFGFAFDRAGLKDVHIPIQLWRAADDRHQPNPWYREAVREALPKAPEYHVVPKAGHYDFLSLCPPQLRAMKLPICEDLPGFNREAFHREFNSEVVRFFEAHLTRQQ